LLVKETHLKEKFMKRNLLALALGAAFCSSAMAGPVISLPDGPLYIKFDNREQIAIGDGANTGYENEINWGVLTVSTINVGTVTGTNVIETSGAAFFTNITSNNAQITGIFYGIEGLPSGTGGNPFPATGGYLDLYWRDLDSLAATDLATAGPDVRTAQDAATGFTDGELLVRLMFASGIVSTDPTVFIAGSLVPTPGTGFIGVATSYGNVDTSVVGAWTDTLNADWFTTDFGTRDVRFRNIYEELIPWNDLENGIIGARSTDPATAYAVPEPATLALLGMGLLGMGAVARRRKV
jgi:hypothetical protein